MNKLDDSWAEVAQHAIGLAKSFSKLLDQATTPVVNTTVTNNSDSVYSRTERDKKIIKAAEFVLKELETKQITASTFMSQRDLSMLARLHDAFNTK